MLLVACMSWHDHAGGDYTPTQSRGGGRRIKKRKGDPLLAAVPKEKRIRNRSLLKAMREEIEYCERCGKTGHGGCHHIRYKSQGGGDIKENLIRLCAYCHRGIHDARYNRMELIAIVAQREGKTAQEVAGIIGIVL